MEQNFKVENVDFQVDEANCPICDGKGCTMCGMSGIIQIRKEPKDLIVQEPRIIVNVNEYNKDKLITQFGRVDHPVMTVRKECSAALTFFNEIMNKTEKYENEEFNSTFIELIESLRSLRIDALEPVSIALDMINLLRNQIKDVRRSAHLMGMHFEIALEEASQAHRGIQNEFDVFKRELQKQATIKSVKKNIFDSEKIENELMQIEKENEETKKRIEQEAKDLDEPLINTELEDLKKKEEILPAKRKPGRPSAKVIGSV